MAKVKDTSLLEEAKNYFQDETDQELIDFLADRLREIRTAERNLRKLKKALKRYENMDVDDLASEVRRLG